MERNISESLGSQFRLPRIGPPTPRVHSPTFARFNPGLVFGPPKVEPIPNITINNYYGGYSRDYNRSCFRGGYRGRNNRGGAINKQQQPLDQTKPFKVLSQAEIDVLPRGQKRRYFKKLAAHQTTSTANPE